MPLLGYYKEQFQKDFYKDLEEAQEFQDYVAEYLWNNLKLPFMQFSSKKRQIEQGESLNGIEVKYDRMMSKTGNVYIETSSKTPNSNGLVKSGIYRNDNSWLWVIGNYEQLFIVSKKQMISLIEKNNTLKHKECVRYGTIVSEGVLIPITIMEKMSIV